jgi:hypothetical protein
LFFGGGEEMLGEVLLAGRRCSPGTHTAGDSSDGERKSEQTEGRDVEKDMHAYLKKDNKVRGFLQLIQSCGGFGGIFRWTGAFYQRRSIRAVRMSVCFCEG